MTLILMATGSAAWLAGCLALPAVRVLARCVRRVAAGLPRPGGACRGEQAA